MKGKVISVFGGSGFLGCYLIRELLKLGAHIKVFSRTPEKALDLKTQAKLGQLELHRIDITKIDSIKEAINGSDTIINLIGIRSGSSKQLFTTHVLFPKLLAKCAKLANIPHLIHFSTIGVERNYESSYAHSKYEGDQCVHNENPKSVILRPGLVFGQNDHFLYRLYFSMIKLPFFVTSNNHKSIKPIHASAIVNLVFDILNHYQKYQGKIINITGNKDYSIQEVLQMLEQVIGKRINILSLPGIAYKLYSSFFKLLPRPIMDKEQAHLLKYHYSDSFLKNHLKADQIQDKDLESFIFADLGRKS